MPAVPVSQSARAAAFGLALAATASLAPAVAPAHAAGPALTIYRNDLALVRERRSVTLAGARDTLRLADVPESLDFPSVRLGFEGGARVTRLAYRFDTADGMSLIDRARGERVRVGGRNDRVTEGTLVGADGEWLVVRGDDGALTTLARSAVESVRLARPPAQLSLRPTLEAVVEGGRAGRTDAELAYLTHGLSWAAEHVLVRRGERAARWSTTVTLTNTSGRSFEDATLRLVAGDPQIATPSPSPVMMNMHAGMAAMEKTADAGFAGESFADYHLYTLDRPATLRDRETQSFTFLEPRDVQVTPRYVYRGGDPRGVMTVIEMTNAKADGFGVPLPGGRVRVYEADASGAQQFTGEARIDHTAVDEKRSLEVGRAFDLAAERREVYDHRLSDHEREYQVAIELRNRKDTDATIRVEESVSGDVEITQKTHPFTRKDANTLVFEVPVAKGQKVELGYTARARF
jgi:hypothetical protein